MHLTQQSPIYCWVRCARCYVGVCKVSKGQFSESIRISLPPYHIWYSSNWIGCGSPSLGEYRRESSRLDQQTLDKLQWVKILDFQWTKEMASKFGGSFAVRVPDWICRPWKNVDDSIHRVFQWITEIQFQNGSVPWGPWGPHQPQAQVQETTKKTRMKLYQKI